MIKIGTFDSWDVFNEKVVVKNCDKSVFDHKGSGVPINVRWFFEVETLSPGEKRNIILKYYGKDYGSYITKENNQLERTRIFWHTDLSKIFNNIKNSSTNGYPSLRFEKVKKDVYSISFINLKIIEEEQNDCLENEVDIVGQKEGRKIGRFVTLYERKPKHRKDAIMIHGTKCMACGFDFEKKYGEYGKDFIEVHHIKPLFELNEEVIINPVTDLVCLCSNCHRIIHLNKNRVLTLEELILLINSA